MAMSKEKNDSLGGLKVGNDKEINISLFCALCELLLLYPIQLLCCGNRLCRWCSKKGLSNGQPFICPFCHMKQEKKEALADKGAERELNLTIIRCYLCSWNGSYKDYKEHLQEYHADLECTDCHECFSTRNSFEEHRQEICEYRYISCELYGCTELVKWSEMNAHYLSVKHQKILLMLIDQYDYEKSHQAQNSNYSPTKSINDSNIQQEFIAIQETSETLLSGTKILSNEYTRLKSEYDQMNMTYESIILQINEEKKIISNMNEIFNRYRQSEEEIEKEMNLTKNLLSNTKILLLDIDGTITFSFTNQNQEMNSSFSLFSPIFRTSPYGYTFILRVCSTIDSENDDEKYLSIFITLLGGEYDAILFYPFSYKISFSLCDQSGQNKNIVSTLRPDPTSSSFALPIREKNNEVGVIKFCQLNHLIDPQSIYVKDGVFLFKCLMIFVIVNQIYSVDDSKKKCNQY